MPDSPAKPHGSSDEGESHGHGNHHGDGHGHGHHHDRGLKAMVRYTRNFNRMWSNKANDHIVDLVDPQAGELVVDLGAGMGPAAVLAVGRGAEVVAVEPTPFMRRILTLRRLGQRGRSRLQVMDGTAEKIPVADGAANAVWAVNSVHHWHNLSVAATEIARVLAPGGRVVLVDEDFDHPDHERNTKPRKESHSDHLHKHQMKPVDASTMAEHLIDAGLVDVEAGNILVCPGIPAKQARAAAP